MDDSGIIALFFARSERAVTELAEKYGPVCIRLAQNFLTDRRDAEECVNDAYFAVWNTVPPERPDPLLSYLCRIVRNLAIRRYHANTARKRNSAYETALEEIAPCFSAGGSPQEELEAKETAKLIDAFLETLDPRNRILFVRRYWYADSVGDLADGSGLSRHAVSVRLSRLRKALKRYLEREGGSL